MPLGRLLIMIGIVIIAVGAMLSFAPGLLKWFGRLPGDIRIERGNSYIFIPITSMILLSVALTLLANIIFRR